ncbi:MAG: hypothetical protein FJ360_00885 [Thaumarchaeota archaeon]|nr:hypothetical protein [Nitrososphaerota archaeon]
MSWDEIEVPRDVRPIMLEGAEETKLGQKNGAKRQYRYGNLHIREHDDKYLVHMDRIDPRKNPLGHLILDAPEVLVGLASAAIGGTKVFSYIKKRQKNSIFAKQTAAASGLLASLVLGYLTYALAKKLKN